MKHTVRTKDDGTITLEISRSKAIKLMCTECMGFGEDHPQNCSNKLCPLYPFRGISQAAYHNKEE